MRNVTAFFFVIKRNQQIAHCIAAAKIPFWNTVHVQTGNITVALISRVPNS
jgi:hypothetical protein